MTTRHGGRTLSALASLLLAAGPADGQVGAQEDAWLELAVSVEEWRDGATIRGNLADFLARRLSLAVERPSSLGDYVPALQLFGVLIEDGRVVSSRRSRPFLPGPEGGLAVRSLGKERLRTFLLGCCTGARPATVAIGAYPAKTPLSQERLDAAIAAVAGSAAIDGVFYAGATAPPKVDWGRQAVVVLAAVPERGGEFRTRPLALVFDRP